MTPTHAAIITSITAAIAATITARNTTAPGTERQGTMIQKLEMTVLIDNLAEAPLVGE